ncbi:MAG: hypothetical protein OXH76_09390 [Boseongicola sp.]|nr:hypothetical protein [Boseongicola sp.]
MLRKEGRHRSPLDRRRITASRALNAALTASSQSAERNVPPRSSTSERTKSRIVARRAVCFRSGPFGSTRPASASLKQATARLQARRCWQTSSCSRSGFFGQALIFLVALTRTLAVTGVPAGSETRSAAADAGPVGRIVLFQKLDASSRKFDDVPDGRVARPGDAVRCGSHHMDCLSAQRPFQ